MEIVGLDKNKIKKISKIKNEDNKTLDYRLKSYELFKKFDMPCFGPVLNIDFDDIIYYKSDVDSDKITNDWNLMLKPIETQMNKLGVIESEKYMSGNSVQWESEIVYHNMLEEIKNKNVIFTSIEYGMKNYPDIVNKYFGKIVKREENKFTALNGSVFSGGVFIYVPPNTVLDRPLQSYFRINSGNIGQFERTLIVVDDNSSLHYIEGCSAPVNSESSLHCGVVEIYVGKNAHCRYSTIQNWSKSVYNLVTQRALVEEFGKMEWVDGNIGSMVTMKYPCCILKGNYSSGSCITISYAQNGQILDSGAKMIHLGKHTTSNILSKSISKNGGNASYRGKVYIDELATESHSLVKCDTMILDEFSKSDTYPNNICDNNSSVLEHEAVVSRVNPDTLYYLESRGIDEEHATELIVSGFLEKFRDELPMEYAVELNQLIKRNF